MLLLHAVAADEFGKESILTQDLGAARHQELLAGARHGDVQFAVDDAPAVLEAVGCEEGQSLGILDAQGMKMFDELTKQNPYYWVWDGIHPTAAGHQKMADLWLSTVINSD